MFSDEARAKIFRELTNGRKAREDGFEGRARVCARRAAGEAIREYLRLRGLAQPGSAYDLIHDFIAMEGIPERARRAAEYLMLKVNEDFNLPADVDLLDEALAFYEALNAAAQ